MLNMKRAFGVLLGAVAAVLIAGCGVSGGGGLYGGQSSPAPTATSGSASSTSVIKLGAVTVKGQNENALMDSRGYTLYYFDQDTTSAAACTGACAQTWPPLQASGTTVTAPSGLSGTLAVMQGANGSQVSYNGHPLYTYSGDTGPGQSNGEGVQGLWHVALTTTPVNTNGNSGGYGYGNG
jgi:predicted lipoprotein with Yx(FWY)xxD motif